MSSTGQAVTHAGVVFGLSLIALFLAYPWSVYHGNFDYPWPRTLSSYLVLAGLVTSACSVLPWWVKDMKMGGPVQRRAVGPTLVFVGACGMGLLFLTMAFGGIGLGLDVPGTRIHGIFFSEWKFATFLFYVGAPLAAAATGLMLALQRVGRGR